MLDDDEAETERASSHMATRLSKYRYATSSSSSITSDAARIVTRAKTTPAAHSTTTAMPPSPPDTPLKRTRSNATTPPSWTSNSSTSASFKPEDEPEFKLLDLDHVNHERRSKPSPTKRRKPARPYADPSLYAHLGGLTDILSHDMDVMICGINPDAHPTNHYWKSLWKAGWTNKQLLPAQGQELLDMANMGMTNLIARPTAEASELSMQEKRDSVPIFLAKVLKFKPKVVAFTGMEICDVVMKYLYTFIDSTQQVENQSIKLKPTSNKSNLKSPHFASTSLSNSVPRKKARPKTINGLQPVCITHKNMSTIIKSEQNDSNRKINISTRTTFFVCLPSPSARVTTYQLEDKVKEFIKLKNIVTQIQQFEMDSITTPLNDETKNCLDIKSNLNLANSTNQWIEIDSEILKQQI
ncbi:uracil DNA N-glycosylase Thp1 [Microbotryomycetes sp. JL221]|nr:uracil DNA N-glycosylase Thp1 [Microbotryomycetes sp. JL221]